MDSTGARISFSEAASTYVQTATDVLKKIGKPAGLPIANTILKGAALGKSLWDKLDLTADVSGQLPTSNIGNVRYAGCIVVDFTADVATGDGKFYFHVPADWNGMNLTEAHAEVITAGTTGTTDIQIRNVTDSVDMLSTKLTIDSAETGSDTAATPAVIDTTKDDVATNDLIAIDVDAVSTTAPKGLIVTLGFSTP